ncbi:MAG TPA: hypothetical protein VKE49_04465 [Myxococcaceae bacterium]|nr:hypothetical protein [Myxococcaceae bacterium]
MVLARLRTLVWKMIASTVALLPVAASACPACAGRDGWSLTALWPLASMILVPFVVAGVVLRIVRRVESESNR